MDTLLNLIIDQIRVSTKNYVVRMDSNTDFESRENYIPYENDNTNANNPFGKRL